MTATRTRKPRAAAPADTLPDELVPTPAAPAPPVEQVYAVLPVALIVPNPRNPRTNLGDLDGLVASIRAVGVQEPLLVERPQPGGPAGFEQYSLLAGHRRLAAAKIAGLDVVPCMVRESPASPALRMEIALVENLQREGLAPLDEAAGFQELVDLGLSQRAIADRVGCDQGLVSKRLSLLKLPSHIRARIAKGTLTIEAALALVKLVGHPGKLKKAAGVDPGSIVRAVENALAVIVWEGKRDELVEVAKGRSWPVVDEPSWHAKRSFATLANWNGPPDLALDVKKHEAEPCHAVMVPGDPPTWLGPHTLAHSLPHATSVCTEPARHKPKGESAVKPKAAPKSSKRQPSEYEIKEAQDRRDRKDAGAARALVLGQAVRAYKPARRADREMAMVLRGVVQYGAFDTSQVAGELLGLEEPSKEPSEGSWADAVEKYAVGNLELHRAALALALAAVEVGLRRNYGGFGGDDVADHFAYLAELGYQPSAWEQAKLDEAAKRDAI